MEEVIVALAVTIPIVGLFVMLVYLRRIENSERIAMIEKGLDPTLFATRKKSSSGSLRTALLFIGVGLGFVGGHIWHEVASDSFGFGGNPIPYFSMIFIFGGLGLLIAYFIEEKKNKEIR